MALWKDIFYTSKVLGIWCGSVQINEIWSSDKCEIGSMDVDELYKEVQLLFTHKHIHIFTCVCVKIRMKISEGWWLSNHCYVQIYNLKVTSPYFYEFQLKPVWFTINSGIRQKYVHIMAFLTFWESFWSSLSYSISIFIFINKRKQYNRVLRLFNKTLLNHKEYWLFSLGQVCNPLLLKVKSV